MSDACERLAEALDQAPLTRDQCARLRALLGEDQSIGRLLGRVRHARPVNVDVFLAIHDVKGWDPLTSREASDDMRSLPGPVLWGFVSLALRMARGEIGLRATARLANVSSPVLCRAEAGQPIGTENFLRLCAFLERHPHDLCERRSTGNANRNGHPMALHVPAAA